ncbi:MAG: DUF1697 domain-containing protein [Pseudonocardia sp.]|nr:DUF1697 domain-containing protein [Pseudonocardia sp.]
MTGYAVLLRGINVGGNRKVPMADLRSLLEGLGYADVRTYLQSGNAVLSTDEDAGTVATRCEAAIADEFGMDVRCLVLSGPELRAVADAHPLRDVADNGSRMTANFLFAPVPDGAADPAELDPGRVVVAERVIYQWCPDGISNSPDVAAFVRKNWKVPVTGRNWNTVEKLLALLDA